MRKPAGRRGLRVCAQMRQTRGRAPSYPNANMRFMFDYLHGKINKRFSTAAGGGISGTRPGTPVGGQFDALVMRTQVAF